MGNLHTVLAQAEVVARLAAPGPHLRPDEEA